jgi:hypothetical protein
MLGQREDDDRVIALSLVGGVVVSRRDRKKLLAFCLIGDNAAVDSAHPEIALILEFAGDRVERNELAIAVPGNHNAAGRGGKSRDRRRGKPISLCEPPAGPPGSLGQDAVCVARRVVR